MKERTAHYLLVIPYFIGWFALVIYCYRYGHEMSTIKGVTLYFITALLSPGLSDFFGKNNC